MKLIILNIIACCLCTTVLAQEVTSNWFLDSVEAIEHATTNDQNILMVFAGSDWCKPCKKLKKEILQSELFGDYTHENLTILYLDFPMKKKNKLAKEQTQHNESLAEKYNKSGSFPKVLLLDKSLKIIREVSYKGQSAQEFIELL